MSFFRALTKKGMNNVHTIIVVLRTENAYFCYCAIPVMGSGPTSGLRITALSDSCSSLSNSKKVYKI